MPRVHSFASHLRLLCLAALAATALALPARAAPGKARSSEPAKKPELSGVVNINTASEAELKKLPGIGPAMAQQIVAARPFQTTDQITRVKGIGLKRYRALKPHLAVNGETNLVVKGGEKARGGGKRGKQKQPAAQAAAPEAPAQS